MYESKNAKAFVHGVYVILSEYQAENGIIKNCWKSPV